ncbi:DUF6238 family protein [Allostreptomyces psammosilenae]|uniref:Uncharacterized protein n=1 Tax=Allostreptomyces psammosilenae TaxID=1892865 RepID=A0A852ZXS9_9ACTN|nr:DUF6238 family protein [Allostreptomyces psammosilenae]NYI03441.1 hypothetical protein [Allostreptomyces psammosilenae]
MPSSDLLAFAGAAIDFHHTLELPPGPAAAPRDELDALHALVLSLHRLVDAHGARTDPVAPIEAGRLREARTRLWQVADALHAAYHAAPHPTTGRVPSREECRLGLPEGAPELTVCQRHLTAGVRVRRHSTPTDLTRP